MPGLFKGQPGDLLQRPPEYVFRWKEAVKK
jgi:hypothetical protein